MQLLNQSDEKTAIIRNFLLLIKEFTGFEAVGIRLREGEDFPYYETSGFTADFVEAERYLCTRDQAGELIRNLEGNPYHECMCGNVICERTNPSLPFFTEGGSFWSNSTTELLASTTEEDRQARTRNRCNSEGYESVALIPLRSGSEIVGLLQLNDSRKGMFTLEMIRFFEGIGASIGIALARKRAEEGLKEYRDYLEKMVEERTTELTKTNEQLRLEIEERKRAEEELEKHREHLEELVRERTAELRKIVNLMAGREVRMAELKETIRTLRAQLASAGLTPVADDPLRMSETERADDLDASGTARRAVDPNRRERAAGAERERGQEEAHE